MQGVPVVVDEVDPPPLVVEDVLLVEVVEVVEVVVEVVLVVVEVVGATHGLT